MKQKKNMAPATKKPVAASAASVATVNEAYTTQDTVMVCLFSVLLFLAMTVQTGRMTMILTGIALVAALPIGKDMMPRMRQRFCVPVIGLLAFALMQGLAAIYSPFDTYAVREYYKFLAAFALAVIVLVRFDKKHVRGLLWGVATVCAIIALVCIDMGSSQHIFNVFNAFTSALGADFTSVLENSNRARINGIYNDANITGAILGVAILIDLYLGHTAEGHKKKFAGSMLLGISVVSFLMAMSRGAMLCFGVAAISYLAFEKRKNRLQLFLLMLFTGIAVATTGTVAMLNMGEESWLPNLMAVLCGLVIYSFDVVVGNPLNTLCLRHGKVITSVIVVTCVLMIGIGIMASQKTEPYVSNGGGLWRVVTLAPGEYTLDGDWDAGQPINVRIYGSTREETLLGKHTVFYNGTIDDATFTVPEDVRAVWFIFTAPVGVELREVLLSDGTQIPMEYTYMPNALAFRLQEPLLEDNSFLQRVQYLKDGWKLFKKAPVAGHGLSATEGLLTSVQPYYYESKFLHCHVLQTLTDTGLLGTIGFLVLMLGLAWILLKALKGEERTLAAILLADWVMMNTHSLMEINFSIRAFECIAYVLLALMVVGFAKPLSDGVVKIGGWILAGCMWLYLAVFGGLLMSHRSVQTDAANLATADAYRYMNAMERFIERDVFEQEDYKISYVANAMALGESVFQKNMVDYAEDLRKSGTYSACSALARYYYLPQGNLPELFACSREGIAQEASTNEAWNYQFDFYRNEVLAVVDVEQMDVFTDGVLDTKEYLDEFNSGRLEEITLTEENESFLKLIEEVVAEGISGEAAYMILAVCMETAEEVD